ncbi:hypothetical protein ACFXD5_12165 [Streptomyces sp. NPDC059385]|uniref:hypothetical protein n=1 Tax=Streptomyces sp. NPDC059385 TaxID=3346817 RepID=UPI0036C8022E
MPDTDTRLAEKWHVEECCDELRDFCPCTVVTGEGDRLQYVADAPTPALAARIVSDHNEVLALREQLAERDEQLAGLLHGADADFDERAVPR